MKFLNTNEREINSEILSNLLQSIRWLALNTGPLLDRQF